MGRLLASVFSKTLLPRRSASTGFLSGDAKNWIRDEVAKFGINVPIQQAVTPPTSWYTTTTFYDFERLALFGTNFWAVDSLHRLEEPKSFVTAKIADEPYLLTNPGDGQPVRGFFNVCRHHGTKVEWNECGTASSFCCPYHGWTYDTGGRLIKATRLRTIENFSAKCYGLEEVDVFGFWPIAWVKPRRPNCTELSEIERMHSMARSVDKKLEELGLSKTLPITNKDYEHVGRRLYDLKCNWKVYVDNYLDGGYHVSVAHKALASLLNPDSYKIEAFPPLSYNANPLYQWSVQSSDGKATDSRVGKTAAYFHLYPNVMLNFYGPWLDINYVLPTGPESCQVLFDWFVSRSTVSKMDKVARQNAVAQNLADSDKVQQEDVELCERVQEGNRCSSFTEGRYAPKVETLMHAFHRRLASEYQAYIQKAWKN